MDDYYSYGIHIRPSYKLTYLGVHQSFSDTLVQPVSAVFTNNVPLLRCTQLFHGMMQQDANMKFQMNNIAITLWKQLEVALKLNLSRQLPFVVINTMM